MMILMMIQIELGLLELLEQVDGHGGEEEEVEHGDELALELLALLLEQEWLAF